jgi:hypothetical protein
MVQKLIQKDAELTLGYWGIVKSKLDMPFPNLSYLIDTSEEFPVSFSQSNTILR